MLFETNTVIVIFFVAVLKKYYLGRFKRRLCYEPNFKPLTSRIVDLTHRRQLHQIFIKKSISERRWSITSR
ncbi:hypothetical protein P3S68_017273 [Capsicum galapagoense]